VISINCMTFDEVGVKGGWLSMGVPNMHRMSSLSLTKHVHNIVEHVHWDNHCGIVNIILGFRVLVAYIDECVLPCMCI